MLIECNSKNLGRVITCSVNSQKYLGVPAIDLIGKNVNTIMPATLAMNHDSFLQNKLK